MKSAHPVPGLWSDLLLWWVESGSLVQSDRFEPVSMGITPDRSSAVEKPDFQDITPGRK